MRQSRGAASIRKGSTPNRPRVQGENRRGALRCDRYARAGCLRIGAHLGEGCTRLAVSQCTRQVEESEYAWQIVPLVPRRGGTQGPCSRARCTRHHAQHSTEHANRAHKTQVVTAYLRNLSQFTQSVTSRPRGPGARGVGAGWVDRVLKGTQTRAPGRPSVWPCFGRARGRVLAQATFRVAACNIWCCNRSVPPSTPSYPEPNLLTGTHVFAITRSWSGHPTVDIPCRCSQEPDHISPKGPGRGWPSGDQWPGRSSRTRSAHTGSSHVWRSCSAYTEPRPVVSSPDSGAGAQPMLRTVICRLSPTPK